MAKKCSVCGAGLGFLGLGNHGTKTEPLCFNCKEKINLNNQNQKTDIEKDITELEICDVTEERTIRGVIKIFYNKFTCIKEGNKKYYYIAVNNIEEGKQIRNKYFPEINTIPEFTYYEAWTRKDDIIGRDSIEDYNDLVSTEYNKNDKDLSGNTILMIASENGEIDKVTQLIKDNANINASNAMGWTALMCASFKGNTEIVKLLIENGADVNTVNREGKSALMEAATDNKHETVHVLLEEGADPYIYDNNGNTALTLAIINNSDDAIKTMLNNKIDVNAKAIKSAWPPFVSAADKGNLEIVSLLIDAGADINVCKDNNGFTPLVAAADKGHTKIVRFLLEKGANPHSEDTSLNATAKKYGIKLPSIQARTALSCAKEKGYEDIVKLINQYS